jgi:hypothetical protein
MVFKAGTFTKDEIKDLTGNTSGSILFFKFPQLIGQAKENVMTLHLDPAILARLQFAFTISFHILFINYADKLLVRVRSSGIKSDVLFDSWFSKVGRQC